MSLIPEVSLIKFQESCEKDIRKQGSVILKDSDGKYIGTFIDAQTDFIKAQAEYMGELSNGVKPKG
jgi:hypothetical protein